MLDLQKAIVASESMELDRRVYGRSEKMEPLTYGFRSRCMILYFVPV